MGAEEWKCRGQLFPMPGPAGLCHGTLAASVAFGKWTEMLRLTQARGAFGNPQYVMAISMAVELPRSSILRAKMHLMVLQLPTGLSQAQ